MSCSTLQSWRRIGMSELLLSKDAWDAVGKQTKAQSSSWTQVTFHKGTGRLRTDSAEHFEFLIMWNTYNKPRQHIKKRRYHFASKGPYSQSYGFSTSHVQMWELDHKEGWALKNWCFQTVVLEKTLENPLDCKEIKSVNPKGNQPWIFIGRTDAEAEAPIFWPPDAKSQFSGKDLGMTEGRRRRVWQRMRWLDGITDSIDMSLR